MESIRSGARGSCGKTVGRSQFILTLMYQSENENEEAGILIKFACKHNRNSLNNMKYRTWGTDRRHLASFSVCRERDAIAVDTDRCAASAVLFWHFTLISIPPISQGNFWMIWLNINAHCNWVSLQALDGLHGKVHKLRIELYSLFSHKHIFIIMMGNFKVTLVKRIIFNTWTPSMHH